MFPIKDTIRSRSFPVVNWLIIIANFLVFFYELSLSPARLEHFVSIFGLVPVNFHLNNPLTWGPLFTHMFIHSGWFHILSNLWVLFIFGDNVEDRLGSGRYVIFYFLGGIAAGLAQTLINVGSNVPAIGASGAIAAVLGAYFFFFPRARVTTLILLIFIPWFVELPAVIFIGFWFVSQLFSGLAALSTASGAAMGGVAWWAHVGGFIAGLILAGPFGAGRGPRRLYADEYYPY